jgi:hypothetical protein
VEWSVPKIYYVLLSNADRSELLFRLLYIIQMPNCADRTQKLLCIIQLPLFVCYINQLPGVERTQNILYIIQLPTGTYRTQNLLSMIQRTQKLLCIIQRRLVGVTLFVCYISINCLEWSVPKSYYVSPNVNRWDWHLSYPKFINYDPTPIGATHAFCLECTQHLIFKYYPTPIGVTSFFVCYISFNCL